MAAPLFFSAITGSKVNRESGVIEGVSVVTMGEARGHGEWVDQKTLEQAKACAETYRDGVRVKAEHGTGFSSIVGTLRNFRIEGEKLLADLFLLRNHELKDRIMEMAETIPGSFGLSISFSARNEEIGGIKYARCVELYSADLVDCPAANPDGLFRAVDSSQKGMDEKTVLEKIKDLVGFGAKTEPVNFEAKAIELQTALDAKAKELSTISTELSTLRAEHEKAKADLKTASDKLATFDAEVTAKASAQALQIVAKQGVPPLVQKQDTTPEAEAAEKARISKLSGLAKVIACEQFETRNKLK